MSFKIGDININGRFVLAPMAGVTNEAFRVICMKYGCAYTVGEMVSDKALSFKSKRTINMTKVNEKEHPIAIQIFGSDIECMVEAAEYLDKYSDTDIIDINMGCPVPKVVKNGAGSALMKDPAKIYEMVKRIVDAVKKPVTVKIRLGWDLSSINCVEVAKLIEKAGAKAITIHARTRSELYSGHAHWEYIKAIKDAVSIPVIGNGDVTSIEDAKRMFEETGCDAIGIARGTLGNPFIFRELNSYFNDGIILEKPSNKEIYDTILEHYNLLKGIKDEHIAMLEMRNHVAWYIKGKPGSAKIKDLCNKQTDFNVVLDILKEYLLK